MLEARGSTLDGTGPKSYRTMHIGCLVGLRGWLRLKVNAQIRGCPSLVFGIKAALIALL
jgi:hypothetical protein